MILARRSRSASAWRAIARTIVSFRSTSLISTLETLIPQVSVCASRVFWMSRLSCSRSASSASSSCLPSTARNVVCASRFVAVKKDALEQQAVHCNDTHALACLERACAADAPGLAVDARPALRLAVLERLTGAAEELLAPAHDRAPLPFHGHADDQEQERGGPGGEP